MTKLTPFYQHMAEVARPGQCGLCGDVSAFPKTFCDSCHEQILVEIADEHTCAVCTRDITEQDAWDYSDCCERCYMTMLEDGIESTR